MTATNKPAKYRLSVRQAADFLCQTGDLRHRDRPVATAAEGQQAHRHVQSSWDPEVEKEVALSYCLQHQDFSLELRGRADGLQSQNGVIRVLEIKTLRHPPELVPNAVRMRHRLQVLLYAWLWRQQLPEVNIEGFALCLIYHNTQQQKTTEECERYSNTELSQLTQPLIDSLLSWFENLFKHRQRRKRILHNTNFPFPFRAGQRAFATQVFRAIRDGQQALIEAPTGSGKSLATLFPALKTMAEGHIDQIIISTARNTSQQAALSGLEQLELDQSGLRTLQLTAKEKICIADSVCNPLDCPRQIDFLARMPAARQACLQQAYLTSQGLRDIALQYEVCPHGLQSYLQPWCDVIIGDYNYVFAPMVRSEFNFSFNRTGLLIDESHNLAERARELFSAHLDSLVFKQTLFALPAIQHPLAQATQTLMAELTHFTPSADLKNRQNGDPERRLNGQLRLFLSHAENWLMSPQDLISLADQDTMQILTNAVQQARRWLLIAEQAQDDFVCLASNSPPQENSLQQPVKPTGRQRSIAKTEQRLWLRCLSPARLLRACFKASHASILFSATLSPPDFFQHVLGLESKTLRQRLTSCFPREYLRTLVVPYINMRSHSRSAALPAIVQLLADTYQSRPGNYWVYSPSLEYQQKLSAIFAETYPDIRVLSQPQGGPLAQQEFLASFSEQAKAIGFVILGGSFGESIDLTGDQLIGSIILGPGLPQMSRINNCIAGYFEQQNSDGFAYAYQLPGWQKVVQAAGRVIRTETDKGIVVLADDRFTQASYQKLMPAHWQVQVCRGPEQLKKELAMFWQNTV